MKKQKFFIIFVFITGASIMAFEMVAFKITVPYFGGSIFVWATIIATVMMALSAGYYVGGKLADKHPKEKILFIFISFAGFLIGSVSFFQRILLEILSRETGRAVFDSSSYILFLFALPVFFLAFSSPFVIKICNKEVQTTGRTTGLIYAFSTVGCVFGVYVSSFFMIPFWGSKITLLIISLFLILISAIGWIRETKYSLKDLLKVALFFVLLVTSSLLFYKFSLFKKEGVIYEKESFYGLIQIKEWENDKIFLDIDASGRWSVYHPEEILTNMYFDYFTPLYYLLENKERTDILIIGHAGGVISRQFSHFFKGKNVYIDGIEIDPLVTKAAREFFHIDEQEGLSVFNKDGRLFLQRVDKKYDLIVSDAYTGALYIPFHLSTKEFFTLVKSRLKDNGIFAQHLLGHSYGEKTVRCVSETINSVFSYTYFIDTTKSENMVLGSRKNIREKLLSIEKEIEHEELRNLGRKMAGNFFEVEKEECVFTDNWAPTEILKEIDLLFQF